MLRPRLKRPPLIVFGGPISADELTFDLPWKAGDIALVDNYVTMHARRQFTGTRRVLASLIGSDEAER